MKRRWGFALLCAWAWTAGLQVCLAGGFVPAADAQEDTGACDVWRPMSTVGEPAPLAPVLDRAVWDGTEMLVWARPEPGASGAYNPTTDSWRGISSDGAPGEFYTDQAVWTGTEMLVWGQDQVTLGMRPNGSSEQEYPPAGGAYDPLTDTWRTLSEVGAPSFSSTASYAVVWTGQEMIVWGTGPNGAAGGAAYDPSSDTWRPLATAGAPSDRADAATVWTGTRLLVWGGSTGHYADPYHGDLNNGAAYDPLADTWTPLSTNGAPSPRSGASGVWTGSALFLYGGDQHYQTPQAYEPAAGGGLYDPITDTWRPISSVSAPPPNPYWLTPQIPLVWDGQDVLVWDRSSLYLYDPAADTWSEASETGEPSPRDFDVPLVWTAQEALIWGGGLNAPHAAQYPSDGAAYTPCLGQAAPASDVGVPVLSK